MNERVNEWMLEMYTGKRVHTGLFKFKHIIIPVMHILPPCLESGLEAISLPSATIKKSSMTGKTID